MTQPSPTFGAAAADRAAVAAALGLDESDLVAGLPVQEVSCGVPFLLVPLRDAETVDRAVSDAAALCAGWRASRGASNGRSSSSPCRRPGRRARSTAACSRPDFGIVEDPATGSASGPLGCYLVEHGLVSGADGAAAIVSAQGVAMGRESRIHIAIDGSARRHYAASRSAAQAVLVGRGELHAWTRQTGDQQ